MLEDPLDHHRFWDGRDDHELITAVRAVFEIGIKDPLELLTFAAGSFSAPRRAFSCPARVKVTATGRWAHVGSSPQVGDR